MTDPTSNRTVLVTGGTGFIAGWCIVDLIQRGYNVRTTVRSPSRESAVRAAVGIADERLKIFVADLAKDAGWDAAAAGCDFVLHVASPLLAYGESDLNAFLIPARDGTLRVLRAAVKAKVQRVVMTSAAATARPRLESRQTSTEDIWADSEDPQFNNYQISKILAERAAWDFMRSAGGPTEFATVLPGAVFGPLLSRDNLRSVQIVGGMLKGRPPAIPRVGFWVVDVRDLVDVHIQAMIRREAAGQRFIAAGDYLWMSDIAEILRRELGPRAVKVATRTMPTLVVKALAPFNSQLKFIAPLVGKRFEQSSDKAKRLLEFLPRSSTATVIDTANSVLKFS